MTNSLIWIDTIILVLQFFYYRLNFRADDKLKNLLEAQEEAEKYLATEIQKQFQFKKNVDQSMEKYQKWFEKIELQKIPVEREYIFEKKFDDKNNN